MNDLISALFKSLGTQVSDSAMFDELVQMLAQKRYRQVLLTFNKLKEDGKWVLNEIDEKNLEAFWWEYSN